ncbi:Replication Protein A like protein [Ditylenchus destructor]|uniref:Replication Protein A like protein n=1 Tax=Ditylenchus destructor TaxID=166010 RepID=A0AAD4QXI6_9BILA|nr:Replication Protein A like protein [Ditylenchus destructor]
MSILGLTFLYCNHVLCILMPEKIAVQMDDFDQDIDFDGEWNQPTVTAGYVADATTPKARLSVGSGQEHGPNSFQVDKIFMPVPILKLCHIPMENDDDQLPDPKYVIKHYEFSTVLTIGIVKNVHCENGCVTYTCCDATEIEIKKVKDDECFTIVRYGGVDNPDNNKSYPVGTVIQAVGKLRSRQGRPTLVTFDVREVVSRNEIDMFLLDSEAAHCYYSKCVPEMSTKMVADTGVELFCPYDPSLLSPKNLQTPSRTGVYAQASRTTPRSRVIKTPNTNRSTVSSNREQQQTPVSRGDARTTPANLQSKQLFTPKPTGGKDTRHLSPQQRKLYEYILQHGQREPGVSKMQLKLNCHATENFEEDIIQLLGDGFIYNSVDDDHFCLIDT